MCSKWQKERQDIPNYCFLGKIPQNKNIYLYRGIFWSSFWPEMIVYILKCRTKFRQRKNVRRRGQFYGFWMFDVLISFMNFYHVDDKVQKLVKFTCLAYNTKKRALSYSNLNSPYFWQSNSIFMSVNVLALFLLFSCP